MNLLLDLLSEVDINKEEMKILILELNFYSSKWKWIKYIEVNRIYLNLNWDKLNKLDLELNRFGFLKYDLMLNICDIWFKNLIWYISSIYIYLSLKLFEVKRKFNS